MPRKSPAPADAQEGLPLPRKLPSQSRSRLLVCALVEACHTILDNEGAQALTVNRLAEVSGVAIGSIYQYFPNKEAIVTLAFEQILEQEATINVPALRRRIDGLPLAETLHEIFENTIRIELRLFRLNREFHLKYYPKLQAGMRTGAFETAREYVDQAWDHFIQLYVPQLSGEAREVAAYMLGIGLRSMIRTALEDDPERVARPAFRDCLVNMAIGSLQPAATGGDARR